MATEKPPLKEMAFRISEDWLRGPRPVRERVSCGSLFSRVRLELILDDDRVTLRTTSGGQTSEWSEALSAFEGLLLDGKAEYAKLGKRTTELRERHWLDLVHPDPEKTIRLHQETHSPMGENPVPKHPEERPKLRRRWEAYARLLGVPALNKEQGEGEEERIVRRSIEDLDKSLGQLLAEGVLQAAFDPESEAPDGYALRDEAGETIIDLPESGQALAAMAGGFIEGFSYLMTVASLLATVFLLILGREEGEPLALVIGLPIATGLFFLLSCYGAWYYRRFRRLRSFPIRFRVSAKRFGAMLVTAGGERAIWELDTQALEAIEGRAPLRPDSEFSVFPQKAPTTQPKRKLLFITDRGAKSLPHRFASGEVEWLRGALLNALRRHHSASSLKAP